MATINVVANPPHRLQQVFTIATRKLIITWMVQDESVHGQRGLYMRMIIAFSRTKKCEYCARFSLVGTTKPILQQR